MLGVSQHDAIDQDARDVDLARIEQVRSRDALDLRDDEAAGVLGRHGGGEIVQRQRLALHGDVAVRIAGGAADERDVDRE